MAGLLCTEKDLFCHLTCIVSTECFSHSPGKSDISDFKFSQEVTEKSLIVWCILHEGLIAIAIA